MRNILTKLSAFLLVIALFMPSCKKTLDVSSTHLVPVAQMWKTKNDARSAVFATYGLFRAALADNNAWFVYGELRSGDFVSVSRTDLKAVSSNNLNATSSIMEGWKNWRRFYAAIVQADLCLEKLELVHQNDFRYTDDELKLDIANVRFLRAMTYFYLVRIWGDVPLVINVSEGDFKQLKREDKEKVLDFATQEALKAVIDLPWQYNGKYPEQQGNYWEQNGTFWKGKLATKGAAYDLLAHISAWRGNYLEVAKYTATIMDNNSAGNYNFINTSTLTNTQGGVFGGQADDIIFALPFNKDYQESSSTGHIESWTLALPYIARQIPDIYIPNDTILNIFQEQGDQRFSINEISGSTQGNYFTAFGSPVPIFSKIRALSVTGNNPLNNFQSAIVIFRYEEVVLLRAEALFYLRKSSDAIALLNSIRTRRGLEEFKPGDGPLEEAIFQERRRELLGEGWRWFDMVRFGKTSDYTGLTLQDIQKGALLWPISNDILSGNSQISQNSYWRH